MVLKGDFKTHDILFAQCQSLKIHNAKLINVLYQIYHFCKIIHDFQDNVNFLSVKGSLA